MKVKDIPNEAILVNNTQDVKYILKYHLGRKKFRYRSLFVIVGDGHYEAIWGCKYNIPYNDDGVKRLL